MAAHTGISKSTVARYFARFGLQPHRSKSFKLSTDPFFVGKVRDIVGLYLNPPDDALVLCVDEKSQVQALERTQPVLPMGLGYVEGVTHDYYRHGTTTLFAALDIVDGGVISQCKPRHRHQEFLSFLKHLDANISADLELHLIADNYATHKHPKVKAWLASHRRFRLHFTPTSSSWLNQVERWSRLSPSKRFAAVRFATSVNWWGRSAPRSLITTPTSGPSFGLPPPTRYSTNSGASVNLLMGHNTRGLSYAFTIPVPFSRTSLNFSRESCRLKERQIRGDEFDLFYLGNFVPHRIRGPLDEIKMAG